MNVALPDEPEGWRILQALAQQERDPVKLASIIDKMNSLLAWHESRADADGQNASEDRRSRPEPEQRSPGEQLVS